MDWNNERKSDKLITTNSQRCHNNYGADYLYSISETNFLILMSLGISFTWMKLLWFVAFGT